MFSNIGKAEMVERVRNMRVASRMSKESLAPKRKAHAEVAPVPSDKDKQTNSGLVFKRKRREAAPLPEHSNSDGRAPH